MKKNTLFKAVSLALAATFVGGALSGCGEKQNSDQVTISISNFPNKDADPNGYKTMTEKIQRFEEAYPNIKIEGDEWAFDLQSFAAKAEGDMLPTLYVVPFTETDKVIDLGYSADITDQVKEYGYYDIINDFCMENISRDGKIWLLPSQTYSMGLFLNLKLFEQAGLMEEDGTPKAPKTFDELIETARIITEKTGAAGFVLPTTENLGGWMFNLIAWNYGVKFINEENGVYNANFNTPECVEALQYIKDLKWKYNVMPQNTLINVSELVKLLATNRAAMSLSNDTIVSNAYNLYNMDINDIGYAQIPAGPKNHVTLVGGAYNAIKASATPEEVDAVFKWLSFENNILNLTEETKESIVEGYELQKSKNALIGIKKLSPWNSNSEYVAFEDQIRNEYYNVNPNHIKLYNDQSDIGYQSEEPVCTQDLYSLLDSCIQEVLTNENADCEQLLEKANSDFQNNFLKYQ